MPTLCRVLGLLPLSRGPRRRLSLRPYSRTLSAAFAASLGVLLSCNGAPRTQPRPGFGTGCLRMRLSFTSLIGRALRPLLMRRSGKLLFLRLPRPRGASSSGMTLCKTTCTAFGAGCVAPLARPLALLLIRRCIQLTLLLLSMTSGARMWATPGPHTPKKNSCLVYAAGASY